MIDRNHIKNSKRIVIKIGSSLVTRDGLGLAETEICKWAEQLANLVEQGKQIILVSSGSVAEGMLRLGWQKRPKALYELQAAAAVGQMGLIQTYEAVFKQHNIVTAQILLTHDDLSNRYRYLNARSTLKALINLNTVPIINENDTVATEEIRFGDNDSLAAMVANLIEADLLIIMTDQQGLYDSDPRHNKSAALIKEANAADPTLQGMAGSNSGVWGRGGMVTKLQAAQIAARSGTHTIIISGMLEQSILKAVAGEDIGTLLIAEDEPITARKRWLGGSLRPKGVLQIDNGAKKVLLSSGRSLLPVGVEKVSGSFNRGDLVSCVDSAGKEIARGLVNYNIEEAKKIKGHSSDKLESILGYIDEPELIHRDNLIVLI